MILDRTLGVLLAGGVGSRLHPLTEDRAKPSVPFGGKYRIIDFTLSNCYHSGIRRILVLTQYKSHSLQNHLRDGWSIFNPSIGEYITPIPPQMRTGESWYMGTADAVFQNLYLLERSGADQVVILSGDHIYRMDYGHMLQRHRDNQADVTVACMQVPVGDASEFGVMAVDDRGKIVAFEEKPQRPVPIPGNSKFALASMGIYVFSRELLCHVLREDHAQPESSHDFGKDILPQLIRTHEVYGYEFGQASGRVRSDGYWRDVGTIDAYFEANMDLLKSSPPLDLYQEDWPIRTAELQSPPARAVPGPQGKRPEIENALLGSGTVINGGGVWNSLLSRNVVVQENAVVKHSVLFDGVVIGESARIKNCIIDKNVQVPPGESVGYDPAADEKRFTLSDGGVVVVPRGYAFGKFSRTDPAEDETSPISGQVTQNVKNIAVR